MWHILEINKTAYYTRCHFPEGNSLYLPRSSSLRWEIAKTSVRANFRRTLVPFSASSNLINSVLYIHLGPLQLPNPQFPLLPPRTRKHYPFQTGTQIYIYIYWRKINLARMGWGKSTVILAWNPGRRALQQELALCGRTHDVYSTYTFTLF